MTLVRACGRSDVPPGNLKFVRVDSKDLVISNVNGSFYAMDNWCTHAQGNLSEGQLNGNILTCPDHSAQFDVKTGEVISGPDEEPTGPIAPEKTFKVTVQGDDVMVEIV